MNRIAKLMALTLGLWGCVAVAGTGTSNEFRVDTRTGVRTAAATEKIQYSTAWATNDAAVKVEIAANGRMLFEGTDAGCYDWTPKRGGLYEFEHLTYDDEATVLDKLTTAFQVPDQPIAADEVKVEAYAGTYDGKGHGLGVSGPDGVVFRFAMAQGGPFAETLLFTNVCDVTVWYEVSGEGYLSLTNSSTVKITPKSIEGATVILGDPLAYTGEEQRQTISQVTVDGLDVTYTVEGDFATEKGEHTMTLTGTGNFEGTVEKTYAIQDVAVSARQRYPWNGLVDLKFTVTGTAGTTFDVAFTATDEIGGTNVPMKTLIREDGSAASSTAAVSPGTYRWAWNAAADLPKGWTCRGVSISADANVRTYTVKFNANGGTGTMQDEKFTYGIAQSLTANAFKKDGFIFAGWAASATGEKVYDNKQLVSALTAIPGGEVELFAVWEVLTPLNAPFMTIDLASGDVEYVSDEPLDGWSDEYKTNKMVMKRIAPQSFYMGSDGADAEHQGNETRHRVTLTKPYYISIFGVTEKQYSIVCGGEGSAISPARKAWDALRGFDMVGGYVTPGSMTLLSKSFDVMEWLFTVDQLQNPSDYAWPNTANVAEKSFVGRLRGMTNLQLDLPTEAQWECAFDGLLGMGSTGEWCLDVYVADLGKGDATDPVGGDFAYEKKTLINKTKPWAYNARYLKFDGKKYSEGTDYHTRYYFVTYNAYGVRRVYKNQPRAAYRSSALSINTSGVIFTGGVLEYTLNEHVGTLKAKYTNPTYGFRLALTVEE